MNLSSVLKSAKAGSPDALNALFAALRPMLAAQCHNFIPDKLNARLSASDIVQESMAAAHVAFPQFEGSTPEQFIAWMAAIMRNQAVHQIEHHRAAKRAVGREQPLADHARSADSPAGNAASRELHQTMDRTFKLLSKDDRGVIQSRLKAGLSFQAIAESTGRTESAVRRHYSRAMERWKALIDPDSPSPPAEMD